MNLTPIFNFIKNSFLLIKNLKFSSPKKTKYLIIDQKSEFISKILNLKKDGSI